jgi:type VI secretion system Hcp family effector
MTSDFFLQIVDTKTGVVKGEAIDSIYVDEINVTRFSIEITGPALDASGSADAGSCTFHEAEFEMPCSIASSALYYLCCTGEILKTVTLTCRKAAGGKQHTYLQWRLHRAQISSYKVGSAEHAATETIRVRYAKAELAYTRQKQDGSMEATPRTAGWDADANAALKSTLPHPASK